MANILRSIFTLWLTIEGSMSLNGTVQSTPPSVNGVLTACAGQQISLTCSHDDVASGNTFWIASGSISCTSTVTHSSGSGPPCGPFIFDMVTQVQFGGLLPSFLNSTAVTNATVGLTGTNLDCRAGDFATSVSVGDTSLCIVAPTPPPVGLMCNTTLRGLSVAWEPVTDTGCAMGGVNYRVTAIRESDMTNVSSLQVTETTAELNNTLGLLPNTSYIISVSAVTMTGGCEGQQATVICGTSIDLPTITPSTPPPTSPTTTSTGLSTGAIAAIAVVVIVLVIVALVIVIVVVIILMISSKNKKNDRGGVHSRLAMVDKSKKTSAEQPTYQDTTQ